MGTQPSDWQQISSLLSISSQKLIPAFGLHPWYVSESQDVLDHLRSLLEQHPHALVGEIGLDKGHKATYPLQLNLFQKQIQIAVDLDRPMSIHAVQATADLITHLPKHNKVMLHSFTGSSESIRHISRLNPQVYYSISSTVNGKSSERKWKEAIQTIPDDRLLIESDAQACQDIPSLLLKALQMVAEAKGWSLSLACDITDRNLNAFLSK